MCQSDNDTIRAFTPRVVAGELAKCEVTNEASKGVSRDIQIQQLVEWNEQSCLFENATWESLEIISEDTLEHEVRYDNTYHLAYKKTRAGQYGFIPKFDEKGMVSSQPADVLEYLERLDLQNKVFGDSIGVVGVLPAESSLVIGESPTPPIITIQPWRSKRPDSDRVFPTEEETDEYLEGHGFVPIKDAFYGWLREDDRLVILDAKPDNFVLTMEGVTPIDLQISAMPKGYI